jgi:hypothetical protein
MSLYVYNNVAVGYCLTKEFSWEPVYDPTGTDQICTKITVQVRGYVNSILPGTNVQDDNVLFPPIAGSQDVTDDLPVETLSQWLPDAGIGFGLDRLSQSPFISSGCFCKPVGT